MITRKIRERRRKVDAFFLRDYYEGNVVDKENALTLVYFDKYLKYLDERVKVKDVTKETRDRYAKVRERLAEFIKQIFKRDELYLDELNKSFAKRFNLFIQANYDCENNTAQKHVQCLKTVITNAWVTATLCVINLSWSN